MLRPVSPPLNSAFQGHWPRHSCWCSRRPPGNGESRVCSRGRQAAQGVLAPTGDFHSRELALQLPRKCASATILLDCEMQRGLVAVRDDVLNCEHLIMVRKQLRSVHDLQASLQCFEPRLLSCLLHIGKFLGSCFGRLLS
jgi:hypothetical protein